MDDLISRQAAIDIKFSCGLNEDGILYVPYHEVIKHIKALPSAQPEVIRCKDCKWKQGSECVRFADVRPFPDDYCSRAERKEA